MNQQHDPQNRDIRLIRVVRQSHVPPSKSSTLKLPSSVPVDETESLGGTQMPPSDSSSSTATLGTFSTASGHDDGTVSEEQSSVGNTEPYSDPKKDKRVSLYLYSALALAVVFSMLFITIFSTSAHVSSTSAPFAPRDGLGITDPPATMKQVWSIEGYDGLINTPGATIATDKDSISRINSQDGTVLWQYKRDDSVLCHAIEAGGNVVTLYNSGHGCSDISVFDSATGEMLHSAMYGVKNDGSPVRLVYGGKNIGIVTHDRVRFLTMSLTPAAEYGTRPDMVYASDQTVTDCDISDVAIGTRYAIVAAKCAGQSSYHVEAVNLEPKESTQGVIELSIDTKSDKPVTIPMVSYAQVLFATQGSDPMLYAWQLDKEKSEISSDPIKQGEFPRGIWDVPNIGYVWLMGETIHVRFGSEDISQSKSRTGVLGNPMPAGNNLFLPARDGVDVWNTEKDTAVAIDIPGFYGTDFAFSGDTIMSFDRDNDKGTITAYRSDRKDNK